MSAGAAPLRVEIEVVAAEFVNFAMAHNRMSFVQRVLVAFPHTPGLSADEAAQLPVGEFTISICVRSAHGDVLTRPCQLTVQQVEPGRPFTIDNPDLRLDPMAVSTLEEEIAAEIEVTVTVSGHTPVTSYTPIRVLAARQWVMDPHAPLVSLQLLAAFVQPNHPAVTDIVAQVGDRLNRATKDPSVATSNVSPERIDQIVQAVCEAVHDAAISYALPPASWGLGQKVRGLREILDSRLGTCLDLTLAIASVLEHLGIPPVLWVAYGHAFLGWWRAPDSALPDAATLQVTSAVNAVDLTLIGVIETTLLTRERRPARQAVANARRAPLDHYFQVATAELVGVVDVAMCRTVGVLPMPVRQQRADGVVEIVEYHAADLASASSEPTAPSTEPAQRRTERPVPPRIQRWKNSLLDLTLRNPLLTLARVTQVPLLVPQGRVGELAQLLQAGTSVSVRACDDLSWAVVDSMITNARGLPGDVQRTMLTRHHTLFSEHDVSVQSAAIARLRYRARTAREETGANLLMLTLARLDWKLGDRELSAPLLLLPVDLKGVIAPHKITADPAGQVTLNLSLLEKLRIEYGFTVPDLAELPLLADGTGVDVEAVIRSVRQAVADHNLPFRVTDEARLAIIAFTGYLLWRDLDEHWERFLERPLVRHLALSPTEPFGGPDDVVPADADLDALTAAAPIPADGSQSEAIAAAAAGRSFVLEGPPGTGKSQTITNIIANQLANGRTVLFVAEKGAALDVVRRRLDEIGLLPFTLDLHSDNARPSEVRRQLKHALALRPHADADGYTAAASDVSACSATLNDYARRLHEPNGAGLSLYTAHGLRLACGEGAQLSVPATASDVRAAVSRAISRLGVLSESTWRTWGFASAMPADATAVAMQVTTADAAVAGALSCLSAQPGEPAVVATALTAAESPSELTHVAELLRADVPAPEELVETRSPRWQQARDELRQRTDALLADAAPVLTSFDPAVFAVDLASVRQQLRQAQASFVIGRKGRLVAAAAPVLAQLRPGVLVEPRQLPTQVEQLAALADRHRAVTAGWQALPALTGAGHDLFTEAGRADLAARLARVEDLRRRLEALSSPLVHAIGAARRASAAISPSGYAATIQAAGAVQEVAAAVASNPHDLQRWSAGSGLLRTWQETAAERSHDLPRGAQLSRWCEAARELEPLRTHADEARWQLLTLQVPATEALAAWDRGLAAASTVERLDAGAFATFESGTQNRTVTRFVEASTALRSTLRTVLPAAVVARRPFQPGRLFGTVAALEREIGRSRGGLSVRQLIGTYGDVIAEVSPCVLVSPDSLARFIAPGAMPFDLVVFDEASQITVADAIGALGRADAAVVAGDSKQMPPTSFGGAGSGDAEFDDAAIDFQVVPDEESILSEAVQAGLPRLWLTWHYRSRDESLISFSNAHYYDGRLLSFPATPGRGLDRGVSFTRVQGTFIRSGGSDKAMLRTNPVEAAAVVDEVLRRWRSGQRSIGVVTFNVQQRGLIEQLLVESGEPGLPEAVLDRHDGVFVKNLENVQGDERDVVIFSTGFSAADNGVLPLNFGPLNRVGGERRLNVAVTRARRRVMVFSSFEPEDLRADQTSSVGIAHLRGYLEFAKHGARAASGHDPVIDRHRDQLAEALRARGLTVRTGLGLSDFQVDLAVGRDDGSPTLAVLLDSQAWAARRTTSDRDGLPLTVLAGQGWPSVARVWLPAWLDDPDAVLAELERALDAGNQVQHRDDHAVSWSAELATPVSAAELTDRELPPSDDASPSDGDCDARLLAPLADPLGLHTQQATLDQVFQPFEPTLLGTANHLDSMPAPQLAENIRAIVEAEGPISEVRLGRHVVRCFGLTRLSDLRLGHLRPIIPSDLRRDAEGFLWPSTRDPLTWQGYRRTDGTLKDRPLDEIAVVEIANAIVDIATVAMGIPLDDLLRNTIRVFGGSRVTATTKPRLDQALEHAISTNRVQVAAGLVRPS